jgi:hypothetical protein
MPGTGETLMAWLDLSARRPFVWGESDCMLEVASWLDYSRGLDAASAWRGRYHSEAEAEALMPEGLEAAMRAEAARLGLRETAEPQLGDIAVVSVAGQAKPCGAILMPSGRWRMKTLTGIALIRDVSVLAAWSLPCRRSSPQP